MFIFLNAENLNVKILQLIPAEINDEDMLLNPLTTGNHLKGVYCRILRLIPTET